MKTILICGSSGYIGREFRSEMDRRKIPYTEAWVVNHEYRNFAAMRKMIDAIKPTLVINSAAFVCKPSVDENDKYKAETLTGNLLFPQMLANICQFTNTPLLHVSTGCLYNHRLDDHVFTETDEPMLTFDKGAGWYVGSKQMAERVVSQYPLAYLCRIRLPFDNVNNSRNYLTKLLTYPKVYDDLNSISHRGDFVKACLDLWEIGAPYGTYNVTNPGAIRARTICEMMQAAGLKSEFAYWDHNEFHTKCATTLKSNAVLSCEKLLATGVKMRPVEEAVKHSIENWR